MKRKIIILLALCSCSMVGVFQATAAEQRLRMATTTSTDNSGLLKRLNPVFEKKHGIKIDVIAVGTGKALRLAENGDVDLVFVHAPAAEMAFVRAGHGIERRPVMHNDFVILGPPSDPAGLREAADIKAVIRRLSASGSIFVSRGDDSGTHKKELALWQSAGLAPGGEHYLAVGQGMGAVLQIANDKLAYTLTDRGTYLAYRDKMELKVLFDGDPSLFNPYHVILVNPAKHPHVRIGPAIKYADFLTGRQGQDIIRDFRVNGEVLFHPDAVPGPGSP